MCTSRICLSHLTFAFIYRICLSHLPLAFAFRIVSCQLQTILFCHVKITKGNWFILSYQLHLIFFSIINFLSPYFWQILAFARIQPSTINYLMQRFFRNGLFSKFKVDSSTFVAWIQRRIVDAFTGTLFPFTIKVVWQLVKILSWKTEEYFKVTLPGFLIV